MIKYRDLKKGDYIWVVYNRNWEKNIPSQYIYAPSDYQLEKCIVNFNNLNESRTIDYSAPWEEPDPHTFCEHRISINFHGMNYSRFYTDHYDKFEHIGYGTINGKDGKPFKTRDGNAAGLDDIIDIANEAVKARVAESGKKLDEETIKTIALAAVKFNDLIHDVKSDYIFEPSAITSFEGKTGPYILYTAVRLNSVLKRANSEFSKPYGYTLTTEERNLLIEIMDFERTTLSAYENRATDMIANYAYDLCQLINNFYHNCPILRDDVPSDIKVGRLYIAKLAFDTLATAIDLMGLNIPREM